MPNCACNLKKMMEKLVREFLDLFSEYFSSRDYNLRAMFHNIMIEGDIAEFFQVMEVARHSSRLGLGLFQKCPGRTDNSDYLNEV